MKTKGKTDDEVRKYLLNISDDADDSYYLGQALSTIINLLLEIRGKK